MFSISLFPPSNLSSSNTAPSLCHPTAQITFSVLNHLFGGKENNICAFFFTMFIYAVQKFFFSLKINGALIISFYVRSNETEQNDSVLQRIIKIDMGNLKLFLNAFICARFFCSLWNIPTIQCKKQNLKLVKPFQLHFERDCFTNCIRSLLCAV